VEIGLNRSVAMRGFGKRVLPQHLLLARACLNARVWFKPCHINGSAKIPTLQWLPILCYHDTSGL
jgi:hypothetical protein